MVDVLLSWPLLSVIIFLPLVGAAVLVAVPMNHTNAKQIALLISGATFLLSLSLWYFFDPARAVGYQFVENLSWIEGQSIGYRVGVDGLSLFFILLSTLLVPVCVIASWRSIDRRVRAYMAAFLLLETMMVGMFAALDLILFYVFFEGILIPMFLIIGVWGGPKRIYASFKFFLYTLLGSIFMLLAILAIWRETGTTDLRLLHYTQFSSLQQSLFFLAFFASFAVKIPMWPVHTWLPDAHVEAPTAGSVILAGVLLKMGGYGFLRFSLPLFPEASLFFTPLIFVLSGIAVIFASYVALVQTDMKKLVAYSSIAHMGFVTAGIFSATPEGVVGAVMQMLSHGLISAALFLCVGVLYDRLHTREIAAYQGVAQVCRRYAFFVMIFLLASVGLPGTSGFIGEFLVLLGVWKHTPWAALLLVTGLVLGASYMLYFYRRVLFGKLVSDKIRALADCSAREVFMLGVLALLILWMGIYPQPFIEPIEASLVPVLESTYPLGQGGSSLEAFSYFTGAGEP